MDNPTIKVRCRTNIDSFKMRNWPKEMACRPLKGDAVQSDCGAVLYIVGITHSQKQVSYGAPRLGSENFGPVLIIELHKYYPGLDTCKAK